jgi:predicted PurR-regulated permease PerM
VRALEVFRSAVKEVAGRRGVRVAKWLGDGVLLVGVKPGPIVATVPGLLLALSVSPELALYAAGVYVVAQQLEGNISLPLLQRWTVHMPPVVSLLAMIAFGLLFGLWGVLLATPMTVVAQTIIRMAYVEDVLEKRHPG